VMCVETDLGLLRDGMMVRLVPRSGNCFHYPDVDALYRGGCFYCNVGDRPYYGPVYYMDDVFRDHVGFEILSDSEVWN